VLPFSIALRAGTPIYEQVIYAVTRAVITGQLRTGDGFPSVRALSQELKINPNTAHRIVAALIEDGWLVVRPGIGTVVGEGRQTRAAGRRAVLDEEAERLVVEARKAGLSLQDVISAVRRHWARTIDRVGVSHVERD
jgi:GntR family transcriptional regulator